MKSENYLIPKKKTDVQLNGIDKFNDNHWKSLNIIESQREFDNRYDEIKKEFEKLYDDYNINKLIYESKFNFEPKIGYIYHLYKNKDYNVLSLIKPNEWKKEFIGSFKLNYNMVWEKVK